MVKLTKYIIYKKPRKTTSVYLDYKNGIAL